MDKTNILYKTNKEELLGNNDMYYKYIFKKTEKIVCAVFYTFRNKKDITDDVLIKDIKEVSQKLLDVSLRSLREPKEQGGTRIIPIGYQLIELESKLRVANAAGYIQNDILQVFMNEVDSVVRSLKHFTESGMTNPIFADEAEQPRLRSESRTTATRARTPQQRNDAHGVSRKDRIVSVLKDKGQASIKDIFEVVSDCSEKTLQRELNALIKDEIVVREGERRWSRYSVA